MIPAAGSFTTVAVAVVVISGLVLLLLRYYLPLRSAPAYISVPVFLAIALPASVVLLVPIDLASTQDGSPRGIWLPERGLLVAWRISYWLTFALTWLVLPVLGEYVDSGYREPKDRFLYSLRSNGQYHLIVISIGALGAIYFFLSEGFNYTSLKGLVMALSYAWGLILAIHLMGHGLVALPKKLFLDANPSRRLKRIYSRAPKAYERLIDATDELQSYERQIKQLQQRRSGIPNPLHGWVDELAEVNELHSLRTSIVPGDRVDAPSLPPVITKAYLANLTRTFKRSRHKRLRYVAEWHTLLSSASRAKAIVDSGASGKLSLPNAERELLNPMVRHHLHAKILPAIMYLSSAVLALASAAVVWSEVTKSFWPSISLVAVTVNPPAQKRMGFFPTEVMSCLWLSYMCISVLYSITVLPIWGNRALVRRTTYLESATWYASQVAKLTVPLAYNFVTFLPKDVYTKTMFHRFLGLLVDLTPLGKGFSSFFPVLILLPVSAACFRIYGRVKSVTGFDSMLEEEDNEAVWREGKILVDRELRSASVVRPGRPARREPRLDDADLDIEYGLEESEPLAESYPRAQRPREAQRPDNTDIEERGALAEFASRVRNTFDSMERPAWLDSIGAGSESGSSWRKLFGGRDERNIRL